MNITESTRRISIPSLTTLIFIDAGRPSVVYGTERPCTSFPLMLVMWDDRRQEEPVALWGIAQIEHDEISLVPADGRESWLDMDSAGNFYGFTRAQLLRDLRAGLASPQ